VAKFVKHKKIIKNKKNAKIRIKINSKCRSFGTDNDFACKFEAEGVLPAL